MFIIKQFITYIQRKQICFLCIFILVSHQVFSQGENNIWCLDSFQSIDFSKNPILIDSSREVNKSGVSTISDKNGSLLFYTNGIEVWDRFHNRMPNGFGLNAGSDTWQNLIVKKPGSNSIYYLFVTSDIFQYTTSAYKGLTYTLIDMSLNGGLGDVIISSKNTELMNPCSSKLAATFHQNQRDIWIISRDMYYNKYYSFLLTPFGITDTIISIAGYSYFPDNSAMEGCSRFSSNGKLLATALHNYFFELYKFNNSSGNITYLYRDTTYRNNSDVEFSVNNKFLYISTLGKAYQYNLNILDFTEINNSRKEIYTLNADILGDFFIYKNADGKIIFSKPYSNYLGCINNPDSSGIKCNVNNYYIKLPNQIRFGLQNIYYFQLPTIYARNTCVDDTTRFHISDTSWMSKIIWNFGDGTGDTSFYPKHVYATTGTYPVTATYYYYTCDSVRVQYLEVKIESKPDLNLLIDKASKCNNYTNFINVSGNFDSILWNNQSKDTFRIITDTGTYTVKGFNQCGIDSVEFTITSSSGFDINLTTSDITINRGDQVELSATTDSMQDIISLEWTPNYDSCINPPLCSYVSFLPNESTFYLVTAMNIDSCISSDTITINVREFKAVFIPTVFTPNGDGLNETFDFQILGASSVFVTIWNRWGEKIYENPIQQNGVGQGWDGTYKGQAMSLGTYTYQFIVTYFDNTFNTLSGTVTLMR